MDNTVKRTLNFLQHKTDRIYMRKYVYPVLRIRVFIGLEKWVNTLQKSLLKRNIWRRNQFKYDNCIAWSTDSIEAIGE